MKVGVLALQGAFAAHSRVLAELGAHPVEVRTASDLDAVDALVAPRRRVHDHLDAARVVAACSTRSPSGSHDGLPVLGTCAGMILLADAILDGRSDQRSFGAIDIDVRRNAFGRQVDSFEADLDVAGLEGGPFHAVFIRAPVVERAGAGVEVWPRVDGHPGALPPGPDLVAAFHPELSADRRLHRYFLEEV